MLQVGPFIIWWLKRVFIPSRFFSMTRQLGFSSTESRKMHNDLQFTARRCSYIIWVNRFNKEFVHLDLNRGRVITWLSTGEKIMEERRKLKLWFNLMLHPYNLLGVSQRIQLTQNPAPLLGPDCKEGMDILNGKWIVLDNPGLSLVNKLNNCWFHAALHFLCCPSYSHYQCGSYIWSHRFWALLL